MNLNNDALDQLLPLQSGSHTDVRRIEIDIPMRYAECRFVLADGRQVRLKDRRQLLGWTMGSERRRFFFCAGDQLIRLRTNAARRRQVREAQRWDEFDAVRALSDADRSVSDLGKTIHKVVAPDGHLLFIAPLPATIEAYNAPHALAEPQLTPALAT